MKQQRPVGKLWNLYKQGGITPAITSVFNMQNAQQMAFIRSVMREQRQGSVMDLPLEQLELVVFDLETTGFSPNNGDEILSVGAVSVMGENINEEESFYSLVNPKRPIPAEITKLTGIDDQAAAAAPDLIEVLHRFLGYVKRRILIAHGTGHDKQFLNAALWKTSRTSLTHRVLDTMVIGKWLVPGLENYGLDPLLNACNVEITKRHHALEDALMTAKLWVRFLNMMEDKQVTTLHDLYAHLSRH